MSGSGVWSFSDPHEYDRAIRAADVAGLRYAGGGRFHADLARVDLGRVWMQRFRESAPRLMRVATHPSRSIILFRTRDGDAALRQRGYDVDDETIIFFGAAAVDDQTSDGPVGFGSISLSPEDLARFGRLLAERDLAAPRATTSLRPPAAALAHLHRLHAEAAHLARTDPSRIAHPSVAQTLEDSFITAMVRCLADAEPLPISRAGERRAALIRRMEDHLAARESLPVYVTDLCSYLSVPERALERACQDFLGMGPKRYLWLRRLHLARRALIESDAAETKVAAVALAHGFWELGRFAVQYRQSFGETPSTTLRRPKRDPSPRSANPFAV